MNKRTGWSRRWAHLPNPNLEALEARLVLANGVKSGIQDALAPAEQHGPPAHAGVTIDSFATNGKGQLAIIPHKDIGGSPESSPSTAPYFSQNSLTDPPLTPSAQPISSKIEGVVAGLPASPALDVGSVLGALAQGFADLSHEFPLTSGNDAGGSNLRQTSSVPSEPPPKEQGPAVGEPRPIAEPISPQTPPPAEPTARPERATAPDAPNASDRAAAPDVPNANVNVAQAVAIAEASRGSTLPAPPTAVESFTRSAVSPVAGPDTSVIVGASHMIDGYVLHEHIHDSQGLPAADFASMPLEQTNGGGLLAQVVRLVLGPADNGEPPLAPLAGDLILDLLPYNVAAVRTALEQLLTTTEQTLLNGVRRESLALGLLVVALATSGMAGHAAWERLRGPRERRGTVPWPDDGGVTRHNWTCGLNPSEMV